jgi:hypothetical protein
MVAPEPTQENERLTRFTHLLKVKRATVNGDAGHGDRNESAGSL